MQNQKRKLLFIGYRNWCDSFKRHLEDTQNYSIQFINDYQSAMWRLKHNSYDILFIQQKYFRYAVVQLTEMSYAMSRPTVIVCSSIYEYVFYNIWRLMGKLFKKYRTARRLVHVKYECYFHGMDKYIRSIQNENRYIDTVSEQIRKNYRK